MSAFNNADFDVIGGYRSLTRFNHDLAILLTVAALLIAGGISYTVLENLVKHRRRFVRLTLDTKLVPVTSLALVVLGTLGVLFTEWAKEKTLGGLAPWPRLLNAFFTAVTPRTAGFNVGGFVPLARSAPGGAVDRRAGLL